MTVSVEADRFLSILSAMAGISLIAASSHAGGYVLARSIGVAGGVIAFFALVMRVPVRREGAIANGKPPKRLTTKGLQPARSQQWWFPTWLVKTPEGWKQLDRVLLLTAVAGAVVFVGSIVVIGAFGLR